MSTTQSQTTRRWSLWLGPAIIVAAVVALYAPTLTTPFIFDDMGSIPDNATIRSLTNWRAILSPPMQETVAGRPVVNVTLAINYALDGYNVRGYHIFNIAFFIASCLTLWGILRHTSAAVLAGCWPPPMPCGPATNESDSQQMTLAAWLASAVVLIWAVHPLQTETIAYVIQRTELLKSMFYLLTLYASMRWLISPRGGWLALAVVACALGMGSKESMVSAPMMVLVYDYLFVEKSWGGAIKKHRALYAGLACTWLVLLVLNIHAPRSMSVGFHLGVSAMEYLQTQAHVLVYYLRLCAWPTPLTIVYDWPIERSLTGAIPAGLAILSLLAFSVWLLWRRHWLGAAWAMFFLMLGPTSSFIPIVTEVAAERRMHLPLLTAILTVVAVVAHFASRRQSPLTSKTPFVLLASLTLAAAIPLALASASRLTDFRDNLTIWLAAVKARPHSHSAEHNLGVAYKKLDQPNDAITHFERSIALNPNFSLPRGSLASIYRDRGEGDRAVSEYQAALKTDPNYAFALQNLAAIYLERGQTDLAGPLVERLLVVAPNTPNANINLGMYLAQKGRFPQAIDAFKAELKTNPSSLDAMFNLGMALIDAGRPAEALTTFESYITNAKSMKPSATRAHAQMLMRMPDVHRAMAHLLLAKGKSDEAAKHARAIIDNILAFKDEELLIPLAEQMRDTGRPDEMRDLLLKVSSIVAAKYAVAKIKPDPAKSAAILTQTAWILATTGNQGPAETIMVSAINLQPKRYGYRLFRAWMLASQSHLSEAGATAALKLAQAAQRDMLDEAAAMQQKSSTPVRHNPRFETTVAIALARSGRYDEATALMKDATKMLRSYLPTNLPAGVPLPRAAQDRLDEMARLTALFESHKPYEEPLGTPCRFGLDPANEAQFRPYSAPTPTTAPTR